MTRVLFVDDEPILLRAIERTLRGRAVAWEARFAIGGARALEALDGEAFDVVVSDLRMPDMDGLTLLEEVRARHPEVLRLALTGQTAVADAARAVRVVHQWIAKPCDTRAMCAAIDQLAWVRGLTADRALLARAASVESLPSPPRLFFEVTDALARGVGMPAIVALIEHDPALAAKLLQIANSAFFATAERVATVAHAVELIGTDAVRGLLIGAGIFHGDPGADTLGAHSLIVAGLARELAPPAVAGEAFAAGLLHDIGDLVVGPGADPTAHAIAGGLVLGAWGLPREIVAAVAYHHDPSSAPSPDDPTLRAVAEAELRASR